jgi:hypothetical protein
MNGNVISSEIQGLCFPQSIIRIEKRLAVKVETHRSCPLELQSLVAAANVQLSASHAVERMWAHDYRIWKPGPTDITNHLGWLTIIEYMKDRTEELRTFGLFFQLVDPMIPDLRIPGKPFTFRTLTAGASPRRHTGAPRSCATGYPVAVGQESRRDDSGTDEVTCSSHAGTPPNQTAYQRQTHP